MSYPELYSDERVILQAQNVKVKSVSFEVVLTTRRLVLIDAKKGSSIPPQEINLATLRDVESGENAIRDPTITISIITISGNTRQMVLTFSKTSGGERRRECDEWVRALRQSITTTVYHPVTQASAPRETQHAPVAQPPSVPVPAAQPPLSPPPAEPAPVTGAISTAPPKKRIEHARPMKKIVEPAPVMPVPVETTSLPTGSFCNRCGNRVPPESVFCNRCGTPVVQEPPAGLPEEAINLLPQQPAPPAAPVVPQIQLTPLPVSGEAVEKKERPIEEVIHSIEPLIEDSVPRTAPAPLVPAKQPHYAPPMEEVPEAVPAPVAAEPETSEATPGVQWPVLSKTETPEAAATPGAPSPVPESPPAQTPPPPAPARKSGYLIAILALIVIAVVAGAFIFMNPGTGPGTATPTVTPTATTPAVPVVTTPETPAPAATTEQPTVAELPVPSYGVWVKITYSNKYTGSVGTPGNLKEISGTGTRLYQVPTVDGPVVVAIQKDDGSSAMLAVDVYKNGELVKHTQTIAPKGIIEMQTLLAAQAVANATG